ncbi:MAG: FapA family protein [Rhodoferax sp.]|nr:FapA family protein [Rhodoferax sp.]
MNLPGITLNETGGTVLLLSQPVPDCPPIDSDSLRALLIQEGFGDCLLDQAAIAEAASRCNLQQGPFGLAVARRIDATVTVDIERDDMTATLTLTAAQGGKPASFGDALAAIAQAGVAFGIDEAAVAQACQAGVCSALVVARGQVAQNGQDAVFDVLLADTVDRAPKLNEQGLIDYREHGDIAVVAAGTALMRRTPATPGVPGKTVKGRLLAARDGHDTGFESKLDGAKISGDDANLLVAAVSGQPIRVTAGVMVEPILRVQEVNMATGNIHFDGTVHIAGEVTQGMKVQASGDIVVDGMVEGGQLDAGGDIQVAGGLIANANLHAGGAVTARFAEAVQITAGTLIAIGDMVIDCDLHSLNQIVIGVNSPQRGRLVGGSTAAALLLRVPLLGSNKGGTTQVVVGTNPELEARYAALLERIESEKAVEANLDKLVKQLKAIGDPKHMLDRVKASRQHAVQVWGASLTEKQTLEHELELALTARVEVSVGVEGAVDLMFGHKPVHLRREFEVGSFSMNEQMQVLFVDLEGNQLVLG